MCEAPSVPIVGEEGADGDGEYFSICVYTLWEYTLRVDIEFDPKKSELNRRERGFGFGYAAKVFAGRMVITFAKVVDGDVRMKAVGEIDGELYAIVFTDRSDVRRIISARPASRKERRAWQPLE